MHFSQPFGDQEKRKVAVVIPLSNRSTFTVDEEISYKQLVHFLGKYDRYFVTPKSLDIDFPESRIRRFDDRYFGSIVAHTKLMLSAMFYDSFSDYEYILIHHLDALVFSDQLLKWCEEGFDYIGPPWIKCDATPWVEVSRVGNGGLSLRKIKSFLRVFDSDRHWVDPDEYWEGFCRAHPLPTQLLNLPRKFLKRLVYFNNVKHELAQWPFRTDGKGNEDYFWADEATRYYPPFNVAPFKVGLRFAFEVAPRLCYQMNNYQLPFGCHAWPRYDRAFWEPYLLK